jgi:hypothetical protein
MATYNPYEAPSAGYGVAAPSHLQGGGETITPLMIEHLRASRPWIRLISILTFIFSGLMILGSLIMFVLGAVGASLGPKSSAGAEFTPLLGAMIYLPFSVVYLLPAIFTHRFANSIDELVVAPGARSLENALDRSRSFWKLAGIMALISVAFLVLSIIGVMVAGVIAATKLKGSP